MMLLLVVIFQGCGKKEDPIPYNLLSPKAISILEAKPGRGGIILRWTVEEYGTRTEFKITRSELGTVSGSCPGCPRNYLPIADLSPGDQKLTGEGKGAFSYLDTTVEPGKIYSYRIIVCTANGGCSEASNTVEMKYK
jgi:hypothetical protein